MNDRKSRHLGYSRLLLMLLKSSAADLFFLFLTKSLESDKDTHTDRQTDILIYLDAPYVVRGV